MSTPADGLRRLREAARAGELDAFCERHRVQILTAFGSAVREDPNARDLDIGIMFEPGATVDWMALLGDLDALTDADVDVAHLNRGGPLIRERALVGSVALYESEPGALARAAELAMVERMDTDWLRRLDMELMAE
jgi:predicted nucleotidyltransferase